DLVIPDLRGGFSYLIAALAAQGTNPRRCAVRTAPAPPADADQLSVVDTRPAGDGGAPASSQITDAFGRAADAGRGLTGMLRITFSGTAAGRGRAGVSRPASQRR
ncbi:hypothetical protein ABZ886_21425, partial [Streptomyces spiralis]